MICDHCCVILRTVTVARADTNTHSYFIMFVLHLCKITVDNNNININIIIIISISIIINDNKNNNNNKAAANKTAKNVELTSTHHFVPIAVETSEAWCPQSTEFIEELGPRISTITNEPLETTYLFQSSQLRFREAMQSPFVTHFPSLNFFLGRSILIGKTI